MTGADGAVAGTGAVTLHGGDRVAAALAAQGVHQVFTLCGGHISPILTGARARGIRVVDVRDEATAVFAADAVARLGGLPGVAVVTAGPGLTNTLTAIKNAQLAQSPVVILGGAAPTLLQGRGALQDIDQRALVAPHVKHARAVKRVRDLAPAITEAFALARAGVPGPVFVECPIDLLYPEAVVRELYAGAARGGKSIGERALAYYVRRHVANVFGGLDDTASTLPAAPTGSPASPGIADITASVLAAAARAIARSERPLLVVGSQAVTIAAEAPAVAQAIARLGIPTYLSGMARGLLGRDHPLQLRHQRRAALRDADCVILAGVPCDFRLEYGRHIRGSAFVIAANRSRRDARLNRKPQLLVEGDAGRFLQGLAAPASGVPDARAAWHAALRERDAAREREIDAQAAEPGEFVNPLALCRAVEAIAADDATFIADGGDFVATASYVLRPRSPLSWLDPGVFGTLGVGAGFAIGARLERPQSETWILFGDGACGYGLTEFDTFVRHGIPVIAVVGNDGGWTQIAREQVKILGDDVGTVLGRVPYHEVARGFGAEGLLLQHPAELTETLHHARALAARGRPVLVNAWLDRTAFREGSISM